MNAMIESLPPRPSRAPRKKALIFAGSEREAYRWSRDNGYQMHEWESIRRSRDLEGLALENFEPFKIGRWNLNFDVAQAYGLYLQRAKK